MKGLSTFGAFSLFANPGYLWLLVSIVIVLAIIALFRLPKEIREEEDWKQHQKRTNAISKKIDSMTEVQKAAYFVAMLSDPNPDPRHEDGRPDYEILERKQAEWIELAKSPEWVDERSEDVALILKEQRRVKGDPTGYILNR